MDESLKKRLEKIEKRLEKIEDYISEMPTFESGATYEVGDEVDELYDQALWAVLQHDRASVSLIQRRIQVSFSRAARILEQLEKNGIVSQPNGSEPRKVLIKQEDIEALRKKLEDKQEKLKEDKKKN